MSLSADSLEGSAPIELTLTAKASETATFAWYVDSKKLNNTSATLAYTFETPGDYLITVSAQNATGEIANDTLNATIIGGSGIPAEPSPGTSTDSLQIRGAVASWDARYGSSVTAYTEIGGALSAPLSSAPIEASGNFSITVGVPQESSSFVADFFFNCPSLPAIGVTPANLATGKLKLVPDGDLGISLRLAFNPKGQTSVTAIYLYAIQDGTISGRDECVNGDSTYTYSFDLTLKTGWNLVMLEETQAVKGLSSTTLTTEPLSYDLSAFRWGVTAF